MRDPKTLKVFEKANELARDVYLFTANFPSEEKFHLVTQIRRAAVSVPSNLVEGCSRASEKDFARFVEIALGSAMECEYQLGLAKYLALAGTLVPTKPVREPHRRDCIAEVCAFGCRANDTDPRLSFGRSFEPIEGKAAEVVKMLISFGRTLRSEL